MELFHYLTSDGKNVFREWFEQLNDQKTRAVISRRLDRLASDNFGDCKPLQQGVWDCESTMVRDIAFTTLGLGR
jgi:putative addiction module killer protein